MKSLASGLLALWLLAAGFAVACGGSGSSALPTISVTPSAEPMETPQALEDESGPTLVPGTAYAVPEPIPTVGLPAVESLEFLTADVAVPELPASFAPTVEDPALAVLIRTTLSGYEGEYSVVVRNLADGRSASHNEGEVYRAASLFKLALLLEAYRQRDAGEIDFAQELTLEEEYVEYDFGTLEFLELEEGDVITLADALKAMIIVSDTPTAVMVQDVVNPVRVDETLKSLGLTDMSVTTEELPTTARDMALLMEAVAAGEGVTAESRQEMLALLLQETIRDRIPFSVPPGTAVAHKTGNLVEATHDVALVWGPAGPYIIAALSDRSWEPEAIVAVSRAVWDYFAANP